MPFNTLLSYQTDLARGVTRTPIRPALLTQDSQAHTIRVACVRAGSAESLNGAAVRGYFVRADGVTVPIDGSVDGSAACVTLTQACYAVPGRFQLVMKASLGNTVATVFFGDGAVAVSQTDAFLDNDRIIPSLEELLQQISAMEEATAAANQVANLQVTATTLSPGAQATAAYAGGVLSLGIPRGDVGQVGAPGGGAPYNILDNSNFADLVAQAGLNGAHGSTAYIADRWKSASATATQQSGYTTLSTTEKTGRIAQQLPDVLAGKTVTAAAKVSGSSIVYCGVYYNQNSVSKSVSISVSAPNGIMMKSGTIPSDATDIEFRVYIAYTDGGGSCDVYWAALYEGAYTTDTLPAYVPVGKHVEMLNCGVPLAPHNLLDNSDFRNPVNQRGQSSYTGSKYGIDRWRTWNDSATITITSNGIKGDGTEASVLYQDMEPNKVVAGKSYTVAAGYSDGSVSCKSGVISTDTNMGIWTSTEQVFFAYSDGEPFVRLWHATKTIAWVALYEGAYTAETLPQYIPKGYTAELAECQRYYVYINSGAWMTGFFKLGEGLCVEIPTAGNIRINNPTVVLDDPKAYTGTGWNNLTIRSVSVNRHATKIVFDFVDSSAAQASYGDALIVFGIDSISADL